ncbi:histidine kinase [Pedobacter sp. ASV28]|uniref:tetratricopeptide repeat-containing sensor histidine kinase n=1 Tax=Pedobacter sp. ASV28 TaxID=2795123 RepID=UPI0018EB56DD|nr:histidine kinase [Pedobacter sp. ASV28]
MRLKTNVSLFLLFTIFQLNKSNAQEPAILKKLKQRADYFQEHEQNDSAVVYLKKASSFAAERKMFSEAINLLNKAAILLHQEQKFMAALHVSKQQYRLSRKMGNNKLIANALNNMGVQYRGMGDLQQSATVFISGLKFADQQQDPTPKRKIYNNLASVFIDLKDKKNSLFYATKSFELARVLNDSLQIAKSLSNLAISEELCGQLANAELHLKMQADISLKNGWNDILSDSYNNLAEIYVKQKKFQAALKLYSAALELNKNDTESEDLAFLYLGMANCYQNLKDYKMAASYFDRSIHNAEGQMKRNDLKEVYFLGAEIKEAAGDIQTALHYRKRYQKLNDSLTNLETQKYIHDLDQKYQATVRERQLTQQTLEINQQKFLITLALIVIIILTASGIIIYLVNKSKNQAMKLVLLQAQIHPHFLFNTLNNLYALSLNKSDDAPGVVLELAQILRHILYECNEGKISLARELEVIEKYIYLERIRYENRLEINFHIEGKTGEYQIEPLFLLPLVENAFKHGINRMEEGWITINVEVKHGLFIFKIANSKPLEEHNQLQQKRRYGNIGLDNIKKRLKILYPKKHKLKIFSEPEDFIVILKIYMN